MSDKFLKFKGLSISKTAFEEKYSVELTDTEWYSLITITTKSWEDNIDELRLLAFRHIREGMGSIGYKPALEGQELIFKED